MMEGQPSQTALHVAAARAAHLRFDPPPHLLEDAVAERLLGEDGAPLMQTDAVEVLTHGVALGRRAEALVLFLKIVIVPYKR